MSPPSADQTPARSRADPGSPRSAGHAVAGPLSSAAASGPGPPSSSLGPTSQANGAVCTTVRDFGTGLSEEVRQRIFEHFFSTKREGLGMGLAIARSIVESFGGVLDADDAIDGGAIFHFTLPALH